jgi:hypothetical protein
MRVTERGSLMFGSIRRRAAGEWKIGALLALAALLKCFYGDNAVEIDLIENRYLYRRKGRGRGRN